MRAPARWLARLGAVVAVTACMASGIGAQEGLARVDELAREGRADEARALLGDWWEEERADASRTDRQQALWLRAVLTVDPAEASLDFKRITVEYPGGETAARALFRLGLLAAAEGEAGDAERYFRTLLRDYPESPLRLEARRWLDGGEGRMVLTPPSGVEEAGEAGEERQGAAEGSEGREGGAEGVQASEGVGEVVRNAEGEDPARDEPAAANGDYSVQLGAFSSRERANRLAREVRGAGLEPRVVRVGRSSLIRVRVGRFELESGAERLYDRVIDMGYEATVVSDAAREVPIR